MLATMPATDDTSSEWAIAVGAALTEALGGRTQRWLAKQVGVDPATISRILSGKQSPSLEQLDRAAKALGVSRRRVLARAGYLADNGTVELDALPGDVRRMVGVILREFGQNVPLEGDDGASDGL
jgi:transcriptional regulator with XRE-family HTH domain